MVEVPPNISENVLPKSSGQISVFCLFLAGSLLPLLIVPEDEGVCFSKTSDELPGDYIVLRPRRQHFFTAENIQIH